nr:uncharacterized protein LOC109169442 [Ipomoea batatas]
MQGRRSLKPTLLTLDDYIDRKKKKRLPVENPSFEPKETNTTMDALPQPPQPNPQPNPRLKKDFGRPQVGASPSCIVLTDAARNYELKTVHYNQLPSFHGSASEDALTFIRDFYRIVQHFPLNDLTEDALRMRCFPYTLKDAAKTWFMSLTPGSIRTWPEVYNKFIVKFYSHAKTAELRRKIATFSQAEGEPFHEAWERFNMLLIQCPHHGYPLELQNQTFYDGLTQTSQSMVDNAAGGAMGEKTTEETLALYEMLGANFQQKSIRGQTQGMYEVNSNAGWKFRIACLRVAGCFLLVAALGVSLTIQDEDDGESGWRCRLQIAAVRSIVGCRGGRRLNAGVVAVAGVASGRGGGGGLVFPANGDRRFSLSLPGDAALFLGAAAGAGLVSRREMKKVKWVGLRPKPG